MKQRLAFLVLIMVLVTGLTVSVQPQITAHAAAGPSGTCAQVTFTGFAEGPTDFRVWVEADGVDYYSNTVTEDGAFTFTFNFGPVPEGTDVYAELQAFFQGWESYDFIDYTCSGGGATDCGDDDGRINPVCVYPWQTAAIYCDDDGGITVFKINADSSGTFAFKATESDIDEVDVTPEVNTIIKQGLGIKLFRLKSGEFEVVAPTRESKKLYTHIWKSCD